MALILGIDPGQQTGVATFLDGQLIGLETLSPIQMIGQLRREPLPDRVVFEDSRLQSHVWHRARGAAGLKIARDIGQIDAWCSLITATCADFDIPAHGISPVEKGAKLDAVEFAAVTGWRGRCNQHERDAALVAWPFRHARAHG